MALGRTTFNELNRVDRTVTDIIRQWLALPNDTPTGYVHALIRDGGLGITSVSSLAPLHRRQRLLRLVPDHNRNNISDPYLAKEVRQCDLRLSGRTSPYY